MTTIRGRLRLLLLLLGGVAVVSAATAVGPLTALAGGAMNVFGNTSVRSGIPAGAVRFRVTSPDLQNNQPFSLDEVSAECGGTAAVPPAPRLEWSGQPAGTQSFAVTMFDPDAPTGSGFWHWLVWNIPAGTRSLDANQPLPAGVVSGTNDVGATGYFGPCPPPGDLTHHYQITVYALNTSGLSLDSSTHGVILGFTMRNDILGIARLVATYQQPA